MKCGHAASAFVRSVYRSLRLDAGRLDDRPPFLDLGLLQRGERFRRLLLVREYLLREIGEPRTHSRIGERIDDSNVELGDYVLRGPLGCPKRVPP